MVAVSFTGHVLKAPSPITRRWKKSTPNQNVGIFIKFSNLLRLCYDIPVINRDIG